MHITVQKLPSEIRQNVDQVAVVVDVLRATTVIATALEHRASEVMTCVGIEEARQIAASLAEEPLLCGERFCQPIAGFDLGNSPRDYAPSVVQGRTLVMTTTNGTRAFAAARNATRILAGAFVNRSAVAAALRKESQVTVVCAGTDGEETEEDFLFAGALIARVLELQKGITLDPAAVEAVDGWQTFLSDGMSLAQKLGQSRGGRNLLLAGYLDDIEACANVDSIAAVPFVITRQPITLRVEPSPA